MKDQRQSSLSDFLKDLSSQSPVPGGGGTSALIGAIGAALCSMVANLTSGKKSYAAYQQDIDTILSMTSTSMAALSELIQKDAEVFEPLAQAYSIPKTDAYRDDVLEAALVTASSVPMAILKEAANVVGIIEQLALKGSRLALSDVGVAASACRCAMEGAIMNVYINTKLMKNRKYAEEMNAEASAVLHDGAKRCDAVYRQITNELEGTPCGN